MDIEMDDYIKNYIKKEIIEEGDLYICFIFLKNNYKIKLLDFKNYISNLNKEENFHFYKYSFDDNFIDINFSDIDFSKESNLKGINFIKKI